MNTTRYNRFCRFYFQRPSPCSPLSSSPTSSAQPPALAPHMEHATPAQSALPRGAALMETVQLGLECAVSNFFIKIYMNVADFTLRCDNQFNLQYNHQYQHHLHQKSKLSKLLYTIIYRNMCFYI